MAKPKLIVDKNELVAAIEKAEKNGPFANRSLLHKAVAATDWAKNHEPKPVTESVVMLRIDEFGIEPKTPKGRQGRKSSGSSSVAVRAPKSKKEKLNNPEARRIFDNLSKKAPTSFQRTIKSARNGSMASALKLKCAQCVGFENTAQNVRGCITSDCPIWPLRPYQVSIEGKEPSDDDIEDGITEDETEEVAA